MGPHPPHLRDKVLLARDPRRLPARSGAQLGQDCRNMVVDSLGGDVELGSDAAVAETPCDPAQRLELPGGEAERVLARAGAASARMRLTPAARRRLRRSDAAGAAPSASKISSARICAGTSPSARARASS